MRYAARLRVSTFLLLCSVVPAAFASDNWEEPEQQCFAMAMVGYDSVINSRLGVPAEHALDLASIKKVAHSNSTSYSPFLLKTILDAYLWPESPHTYAVKVMYRCAKHHSDSLHSAQWQ